MGKCCSKRQEPQPIGKFIYPLTYHNVTSARSQLYKKMYWIKKNILFYFLFLFLLVVYKKADAGLSSKHSNGGSLDRYTADPNQRGVQARADIIRPRPTPCKLQIPHQPRKTSSPVVVPACVYFMFRFSYLLVFAPIFLAFHRMDPSSPLRQYYLFSLLIAKRYQFIQFVLLAN